MVTFAERAKRGRKTVTLQENLLKLAQAKLASLTHEAARLIAERDKAMAKLQEITGPQAIVYLNHLRKLELQMAQNKQACLDAQDAVSKAWRTAELAQRQYDVLQTQAADVEGRKDLQEIVDAALSRARTSLP